MTPAYIIKTTSNEKNTIIKCIAVFLLLVTPLISITIFLYNYVLGFRLSLFFTGWFTWTFIEYMLHRFRSHGKHEGVKSDHFNRHQNHHQHPTDIRVTFTQRVSMFLISILLFTGGLYINSSILFAAGLFTGFFCFCQVHYFLHQPWVKKVFPVLWKFHLVHHCKQPNSCFGVTITWWDRIFKTTPPKAAIISSKVVDFYFRKKTVHKKSSRIIYLDEALLQKQ